MVNNMSLSKERNKRSSEIKFVLIIALFFILYLINTSEQIIFTWITNFWASVILSIFTIIGWFLLTKKHNF